MKYWAVVPAAGSGTRMRAHLPKQYLPLHGKTVIEHTLNRLCAHPAISGIVLALAENDQYWDSLGWICKKTCLRVAGGAERCHTVLNALDALETVASPQDWVLVHDAARPCVRSEDIDRLIGEVKSHPVGGLLGVPVRDTMKRSDSAGCVQATLDRNSLWHALTPQMFRFELLCSALRRALEKGTLVTDESMALELLGMAPRLVEGHADNIKITRSEDLALAEFFMREQERVIGLTESRSS